MIDKINYLQLLFSYLVRTNLNNRLTKEMVQFENHLHLNLFRPLK